MLMAAWRCWWQATAGRSLMAATVLTLQTAAAGLKESELAVAALMGQACCWACTQAPAIASARRATATVRRGAMIGVFARGEQWGAAGKEANVGEQWGAAGLAMLPGGAGRGGAAGAVPTSRREAARFGWHCNGRLEQQAGV